MEAKDLLSDVSKMKRDDVVPFYVAIIRGNASAEQIKSTNDKILSKWSKSGLLYIKDKAWAVINSESKKPPELVSIAVIGHFSDGTKRQIFANETQQRGVCAALCQLSANGKINVSTQFIDGLEWETNIDLRS